MSFIWCTVVFSFRGCYDAFCGCVFGGVCMCVVCVLFFVRCVCESNKEYGLLCVLCCVCVVFYLIFFFIYIKKIK